MATIQIHAREYEIKLPVQFAPREELLFAYSEATELGPRLRVHAAMIGLCTELGREFRLDYTKAGFSVLAYGGAVYGELREAGIEAAEIVEIAQPILKELQASMFPREGEVKSRAGFFDRTTGK